MIDSDELEYLIALTLVPQIGCVQSKILLEHLGNAREIFKSKRTFLEKIPGIGSVRAKNICQFKEFGKAEKEIRFIEKYKIKPLPIVHEDYPHRLKQCTDPPTIIFYKGNADLNSKRIISVVGTRKQTEYGRMIVEQYIEQWRSIGILIVSGLAYGIDHIAHKNALRQGLPTVGVLANGLDSIYPPSHSTLARDMVRNGGLLTEFISGTKPDKQNFPRRNRIVAGICDAVLVIETDVKGGSMITADIAAGYNREVFAIPGKIHDKKSAGCNRLIRENKARLSLEPHDIVEFMNWDMEAGVKQQAIFPVLDNTASGLLRIIRDHHTIHIDRLYFISGLSRSAFHGALLSLELEGIVEQVPGNVYVLKI